VNQCISVAQIIQKFVAQSSSLVRSWHKTRNVQQFNGDRAPPFVAAAIIGPASIRHVMSLACAFDLKVSDGSLGVNGGEAANELVSAALQFVEAGNGGARHTESFLLRNEC
jgi:hypothetical protein